MKAPAKRRQKLLADALHLTQIDDKARRKAMAVLEVLAGLRTAEQGAAALEISLPAYFMLETRALRGLIWACTPIPPGRQHTLDKKLRLAEQKIAAQERQLQRYQAILRSAQRSVGLSAPPTPSKPAAGKRKARKPVVRALRAIHLLKPSDEAPAGGPILAREDSPTSSTPALASGGSTLASPVPSDIGGAGLHGATPWPNADGR